MISVIIPVYNVERFIARCLDSVINQSFTDIEIIVVNDATPDNSMEIVEEYAAKDSRICVVNNPGNMGLMMTRKNGYSIAKGEYLTFVDSDDYLPLNALELMLAKAKDTDADIVAGNLICVNTLGEEKLKKIQLPYGENAENVLNALLKGEFLHSMCAKLFKKELLQNHQYVTYEKMINAEDVCLFYQLVDNAKRIVCIPESVYYYMENPRSSTHLRLSSDQVRCIIRANKIRLKVCSQYPELEAKAVNFVTNVFANLHTYGFRRTTIAQMLKDEGLERYYTISHILHTLSLKELCTIVKNTIISILKR